MKKVFQRIVLLNIILLNNTNVLGAEILLENTNDPSCIRKYGESLIYSPFLVDKYQPEQLIQNWRTINKLYTHTNQKISKEFGEEITFKRQQLKRLLDSVNTHIRSRNMSKDIAFNFQYVTFSEVCYTDHDTPEKIAKFYGIPSEVLDLYLENNQ